MTQPVSPPSTGPARTAGTAPDEQDPLPGSTLHDTYTVVRFMAEGGMGRVYEAQHTRISTKRFALKVLHGELKHSMEVRMRFRREAEAAATISHPNVVGVHDFGVAPDGRPYLVCDYLDGMELAAMLTEDRPLSVSLSVKIIRQVCRGLEAAHEAGVIHRDLKPANVFLVGPIDEPEVRVLDFGLSKVIDVDEATVTQTGVVMGTPAYMSPEQANGQRADHRADVYGAGAVLYACLTGRAPFDAETPHGIVLAVMTQDPPRPRSIAPTIPAELEVVVQKAMSRSPDERYQTMRELDAALARFDYSPLGPRMGSRAVLPNAQGLVPRKTSEAEIANEMEEVRGVRRRAVGWLLLAVVLAFIGLSSAGLGLFAMMWPHRRLLPSELLLATLAVLGSVFTPGLLFLGWLRRSYWNNSARMVNFVAGVRAPVVAAIVVYGLVVLVGRAVDATSPQLVPAVAAPNVSGWAGWGPFAFGVGLIAAMAALVRRNILGSTPGMVRRFFAGPVIVSLALAGAFSLLASGYRASHGAHVARNVPGADADATADTSEPRTKAASPEPAGPRANTAAPEGEGEGAAPTKELAKARAGGIQALQALRARYPKDANVLKALAFELGKEPEQASELLRVLDALFAEAPTEAKDAELRRILHRTALAATTSQRAIDLMKTRMGSIGADMLFDIVLDSEEHRDRARQALESLEVQRAMSPALRSAFDLYFAPTCPARVGLLPQAAKDGDQRAIIVLTRLSAKPKVGCTKKRPCFAPCHAQAQAMEQTILQIRKRQQAGPASTRGG